MANYRKFNILSTRKNCCGPTVCEAVSAFIMSKKSMNCTKQTVRSYTDCLRPFQTFCDHQEIKNLEEIDNFFVVRYFADMRDKGASAGSTANSAPAAITAAAGELRVSTSHTLTVSRR